MYLSIYHLFKAGEVVPEVKEPEPTPAGQKKWSLEDETSEEEEDEPKKVSLVLCCKKLSQK